MKKIRNMLCSTFFLFGVCCLVEISAKALEKQDIYSSPYVTFAPDGQAWTTNARDTNTEWYAEGTTVSTGIPSSLRALEKGEHYYDIERIGEVPIGCWKVVHRAGTCIHDNYFSENEDFHGIDYKTSKCMGVYNSGWNAYCADCAREIDNSLIYMSREAAESIDYMDLGNGENFDYYFLCPHCNNLEQGSGFDSHVCKAISLNQYKVIYAPNVLPSERYGGYMTDSIHMYNNSTGYNGEYVTPTTHLIKNVYTRIGYEFVEWNTEPDGSGMAYQDGQEILNLSIADWNDKSTWVENDNGKVILYAQWRPSKSTLIIDPNGGTYNQNSSITSITDDYGSSYTISGVIKAPKGYQVNFEENGGEEVADVESTRHFTEWSMTEPFQGRIKNNEYYYIAPDGSIDTIVANYELDSIILPEAHKDGSNFGGWFYDSEFTKPAGGAGEKITPREDITLYASWVELALYAKDNYTANGGKGAVDLWWEQEDKQNKTYKLYQSRDNVTWSQIISAMDIGNVDVISEDFPYTGQEEEYIIPYSGFYTLTAYGAQGGDYGSYKGGYGGMVTARIWLQKGEEITYIIGGQNGYNGGGSGTVYGNGGGATIISSNRQGILLVAGGGGGAGNNADGEAGGSLVSLRGDSNSDGASGQAGGGAGYVGGNAGEHITHAHTTACAHTHQGNVSSGGECYVLRQSYATRVCRPSRGGMANIRSWTCGVNGCTGTVTQYHYYSASQCGEAAIGKKNHGMDQWNVCDSCNASKDLETIDRAPHEYKVLVNTYVLSCGMSEGYTCGYTEGQILASKPAYGGSNYVNPNVVLDSVSYSGVHVGNGAFELSSQAVGYLEEHFLNDVVATDFAAPDIVSKHTVTKEPVGSAQVKISWKEPEDNGTDYYHVAESFLPGSSSRLSKSNVTKNTLTSGVAGYYYICNKSLSTVVTAQKAMSLDLGEGGFREEGNVTVDIARDMQYLHVAAVDQAGNVGNTVHIAIDVKDVQWKLYTEQLTIKEGDNVYPSGRDKTWYVRADGSTPFTLLHEAYVDGPVTVAYQPNYTIYESVIEGIRTQNVIFTPSHDIQEGTIQTDARDLSYFTEGQSQLIRYPYSYTIRSEQNRRLSSVQKFQLEIVSHEKCIKLIPITGVAQKSGIVYSNHELDEKNSITIIGDGKGPIISGLEVLKGKELINRNNGEMVLNVTAYDDLSGVGNFYLEVTNIDNYTSKRYIPDTAGSITVKITEDEPVFSGDFLITVYAVDNVGNEQIEEYATTEFAMEAKVERILSPHNPVFQCGESGLLTVTTWGYADYVEIEFPEEMTDLNPLLNHTYYYADKPQYKQEDSLQFMIPLYTPTDIMYSITVRAYKGDKLLEEFPCIGTVSVEGSILDDIRTRLR